MMGTVIKGGRIIDPANNYDAEADLYIEDDKIVAIGSAPEGFKTEKTIDAGGLWVLPGLVDLQARLREPGLEHKATIDSETFAAVASGITTLCCPPDTTPVNDTAAVTEQIIRRANHCGNAKVLPLGALTLGLNGEHLSEMLALKQAGCVGVSNARYPIANTLVMRRALEYAATLGITVHINAEDPWLGNGTVHEGEVSNRLGLAGIPECAEVIAVARDLTLIEQTGTRVHFGQLSSLRAVELIAEAQAKGLPVTADVSAHQLFLTDRDLFQYDSNYHVRPPLRTQRDRDGLRAAVADGVISAICSDHQPHDADAKLAPFSETEAGISALETLLPLTMRLVEDGVLDLNAAIHRLTAGPAAVFNLNAGKLEPGAMADITLIDAKATWHLEPERMRSSGRNTPFAGWPMGSLVKQTLIAGRSVFTADQ